MKLRKSNQLFNKRMKLRPSPICNILLGDISTECVEDMI